MIEVSEMDPFKKRVYDEFEAAYEFAGAAFVRQSMSWRLCALEQVYHETKIGRELTDDEQLERFTSWNVGLNAEILNAYYYTCMTQQEQASETKKERKGV